MKIRLRCRRSVTDCEQAFAEATHSATRTMPTLLDNAPDSLTAASARLDALRHRMIGMLEWFAALVALAVILLLTESVALAASVGAGAIAALVICGLALDERRRLLMSLVAIGDANSIPEVRALAERLAHDPAERRRVAAALRTAARAGGIGSRAPMVVAPGRVALYAPRLLALADAIGDERRVVTAPAIALCRRLLSDGAVSPLYNPHLPARELERVLAVVEAGIAPSAAPAGAAALAADSAFERFSLGPSTSFAPPAMLDVDDGERLERSPRRRRT